METREQVRSSRLDKPLCGRKVQARWLDQYQLGRRFFKGGQVLIRMVCLSISMGEMRACESIAFAMDRLSNFHLLIGMRSSWADYRYFYSYQHHSNYRDCGLGVSFSGDKVLYRVKDHGLWRPNVWSWSCHLGLEVHYSKRKLKRNAATHSLKDVAFKARYCYRACHIWIQSFPIFRISLITSIRAWSPSSVCARIWTRYWWPLPQPCFYVRSSDLHA